MAVLILGNLLSVQNPDLAHGLRVRNPAMVEELVVRQAESGVGGLHVDLGSEVSGQAGALNWLLQVGQGAAVVPWAVRTADAEALAQAAGRLRCPWFVDATTPSVQDWRPFLEIGRAHGAALVLPAAPGGQPAEGPARAAYVARQLLPWAVQAGIPAERLWIDICPTAVARGQAQLPAAIETALLLRRGMQQPPRLLVHLADVSVGAALPLQRLLHRSYLAMALAAGVEAVVLDPLDEQARRMLRLMEQRDGDSALGKLLLRLAQAVQEGRGLRPDEVDLRDLEQAALYRAVGVLCGEAAYSEVYLEGRG